MLRFCLSAGLLLVCASCLQAAFVPLTDGVTQSGWKIRLSGAASSYDNVVVDPNSPKTVFVRLGVDFGPTLDPEEPPTAIFEFQQYMSDADTANRIVIRNETIHNSSGDPLNTFNWFLPYYAVSSFRTDSSWSVSPFAPTRWDANTIVATGDGWLWSGWTLTASGDLVIDVDLSGTANVYLALKQTATPEPATMALVAGGMSLLCLRRGKRGSL